MRADIAPVSMLTISILLTGCGHLSRESAAGEIEKSVYLKVPQVAYMEIGSFTTEGRLRCYEKIPNPLQKWALSKGLISATHGTNTIAYRLTQVGEGFIDAGDGKVSSIPGSSQCGSSYLAINLANATSVDVFGVLEDANSASVDFATHWKLTEAGGELVGDSKFRSTLSKDEITILDHDVSSPLNESTSLAGVTVSPDMTAIGHSGEARFLKYDDGWRLDKIR
jgi:hypothetical protein